MGTTRYSTYLAVGILSTLLAKPASAQLATSAASVDADAGDIIVTAQKRSQRLSDVGITVTAASGLQLQNAGVTDVTSLSKVASGLSVGASFTGYTIFSIRGVNFNTTQASASPAVSVYLDEASLPYGPMTAGVLLDVDHVEILKGPQGTLFGQNATGGSINVIAAKPTSTLTAGLHTEVNNFGQIMLEGYVSGPISSNLRARLAANTTQFGTWQRGYYLQPQERNGDQNKGSARLLLDWTPTERLTLSLNVNANYDRGDPTIFQLASLAIKNPAGAPAGLATYQLPTSARDAEYDPGSKRLTRNRTYQTVLRADYDVTDSVKLTSITDYVNTHVNIYRDIDGTAIPSVLYGSLAHAKSFSQEFRLTGKAMDSRLNYILGGSYSNDKFFESQYDQVYAHYSALPPGLIFDAPYNLKNTAWGVFGNVDFEVLRGLTFTAGVRYSDTKQGLTGCSRDGGGGTAALFGGVANSLRAGAGLPPTNAFVPGGCITIDDVGPSPTYLPVMVNISQKQHNLSWRVGLNYKPTKDMLIYGLISRGYKAGMIPVINAILASEFDPASQEELTSYEVGAKAATFDGRLRGAVSLFYYDYRNKQFQTYASSPIGPTLTIVNIPKSTVKGLDADVTANPIKGLTLHAAVTYIKSDIKNFHGFDLSLNVIDFSGPFNFAPAWSGTFDSEYRLPVNEKLDAFVGASGLFNSKTYSDLGQNPTTKLIGYATYDARLGVESHNGWRVSVWVRNLTNKYYWTTVSGAGDVNLKLAGLPRTFGASYGVKF